MVPPELEFEKFLGEGTYGSVNLFKYSKPRDNNKTLYTAVKTSDYEHALSLYKEFQILSQFKGCPRIIQCYENRVIQNLDGEGNTEYMMLMEYAAGGSLRSFMERFKDQKLPDPLIREFTRMLLEGLAMIHRHNYVHCDLKPENILVFPSCVYKNGAWRTSYELKISDFGITKREGDSDWWSPREPYPGTPIYMSPESISHGELRKGLDLWSLGCAVLEMYTGKSPWWHKNYDVEDLKNCYEPLIPNDLPFDAKCFISTCFALETDERKDALTLLRYSFLRGADVNKITSKPPVNVKNESSRQIDMKLKKAVQLLSEIKNMKLQPTRPNLVPHVQHCHLAEPTSQSFSFFSRSLF